MEQIPPTQGSEKHPDPTVPSQPSSPDKILKNVSKSLTLLKSLNQGNYYDNSGDHQTSSTETDNETDSFTTTIATTIASRNYATSWILEQVRTAYRERLKSFSRPSTYFAKPIDISPLVCARFGWINTAPNVLTCANNDTSGTTREKREEHCCNAVIYVKFLPTLSPQSQATLARTYRRLLAVSHSESCPFRADAERWLVLNNDGNREIVNNGFEIVENRRKETTSCSASFVPPYLFSMSPEFTVFEDYSRSGFIARKFVRKEATTLGIAMKMINLEKGGADGSNNCCGLRVRRNVMWRVSAPNEVLDHIEDKLKNVAGDERTVRNKKEDAIDLLQEKLMICLRVQDEQKLCSQGDGIETKLEITKEIENKSKSIDQCCYIRKEAALLAVFGWRFELWPSSSASKVLRVRCPLCLASAQIPWYVKKESENINEKNGEKTPSAIAAGNSSGGATDVSITNGNNNRNELETTQSPLKKRRKLSSQSQRCEQDIENDEIGGKIVTDICDKSTTTFDVLSSHRHFCPYTSGFSSYREERESAAGNKDDMGSTVMMSTAMKPAAGWKRVIDILMRREEERKRNGELASEETKNTKEETFQMLRRALRS